MPEAVITKKEKILIIDGNSPLSERLVSALGSAGYETILAVNSSDGLKAIYDRLPHLVILDMALPEDDVQDILEKKQAEPMLAKIPVFLLSSQGSPINMRLVPDKSVTEFVASLDPEPTDIVGRIDRYFDHVDSPASVAGAALGKDKKKILWVEDDRLIGTILSKKFISSGFAIIHTKNGEEGMASLKNAVPDVIVLDLLLPGDMSGFDILQKMKMDARLKGVPVMILSNLSKQSDIERAKLLGAQKFLVKAASSLDQIVAKVKSLVS